MRKRCRKFELLVTLGTELESTQYKVDTSECVHDQFKLGADVSEYRADPGPSKLLAHIWEELGTPSTDVQLGVKASTSALEGKNGDTECPLETKAYEPKIWLIW